MIKANKKTTTPKKTKGGKPANSSSSKKPLKLSAGGKMSPKDRFKAMMEAKKKKGGKGKPGLKGDEQKASITAKKPKLATGRKTKLSSGGKKQKYSITAKKPKVVKHKKKGRV